MSEIKDLKCKCCKCCDSFDLIKKMARTLVTWVVSKRQHARRFGGYFL